MVRLTSSSLNISSTRGGQSSAHLVSSEAPQFFPIIQHISLNTTYQSTSGFQYERSGMSSATHPSALRSLYRRVLRELPPRPPHAVRPGQKQSLLATPSPLQKHIRSQFTSPETASDTEIGSRLQEVDQFVQYVKAQRVYITLVERYNPGANFTEEEKVRLTARRVGMDMPEDWYGKK